MIEMTMRKSLICVVLLAFGFFCEIRGWMWRSKECNIPKGSLYDRATFRLQYSDNINPLDRGERVGQYHQVVVVCDKDILSDLIMTYHVITCHRGKWKPSMPQCAGPKNCNQLDQVTNAIPEVLVGNSIDYPHGTVLRYTCKPGYTLTGHDERYCQDGGWSVIRFNCTRKEAPKNCNHLDLVTNAIQEALPGNSIDYPHGTVVRYTCEAGYTLIGQNERQCRNGVWDGVEFNCTKIYVPDACEALQDRFEMVNDIGSVTQIENGSKVRLQCPWSWVPKNGILVASCIDGEWKPSKPECTVFCKLPRKRNTFYTYPGREQQIPTPRVANRVTVEQHCRIGRRKSSSTCINGRWRPVFRYCPTRRRQSQTMHREKSVNANCTVPDNALAVYISIASGILDTFDEVPQFEQIMQACAEEKEYTEIEFNDSRSSLCYGGKWVPAFKNCSNSSHFANEIKCYKPDIDYAVLMPDLEEYFVNETIKIKCHKGHGVMEHNITCLDTGKWSEFNTSCEACANGRPGIKAANVTIPDNSQVDVVKVGFVDGIEECAENCLRSTNFSCKSIQVFTFKDKSIGFYCKLLSEVANDTSGKFLQVDGIGSTIYNINCDSRTTRHRVEEETCKPPQKRHVVYWPVKELYELNDTITVLECGDGLVLAGSAMMRCSTAGSWEGDFECLPSCANGRPVIKAANVTIPDNSQVDVVKVGFVDGIEECAENCLRSTNFSCKSIQVFTFKDKSIGFYCKLISEVANDTSGKFLQVDGIGSTIYNINCDNTCLLPTDEEVILTNIDGQERESNETMPDGTVLIIGCVGENLQKQTTVTCIAGKWNKPKPYCNLDMV